MASSQEKGDKQSQSAHAQIAKQTGSCHCGAVRFEAEMDLSSAGNRCNCSICTKLATTNGMVKPAGFKLLQGKEQLTEYQFGSKHMTRYFCKTCGVHCFGKGRLEELGGDYVAINMNCLDSVDLSTAKIVYWDGRRNNWEAGTRDEPWPYSPSASAPA